MTRTTPGPQPGLSAAPSQPGLSAASLPGLSAAVPLSGQATAAGLRVLGAAAWPESAADRVPPPIPGFVVSSFSPLAAETARRCLARRPAAGTPGPGNGPAVTAGPSAGPAVAVGPAAPAVTAVIVVSALGDLAGAVHVAEVTDRGGRPGPLLFFQAVPNAVAGHVAARWQLTGPVVCVGDTGAGLDVAALLLEDGDADEALLIRVDQAATAAGRDRADAVLLSAGAPQDARSRHGSTPQDYEREQP